MILVNSVLCDFLAHAAAFLLWLDPPPPTVFAILGSKSTRIARQKDCSNRQKRNAKHHR